MVSASIVACFILLFLGALGVLLPFLPGVPLAWLGIFLYALATGFETLSVTTIGVFFGLMVLTQILDFIAPMLGAKKYRASKYGIIGALIGGIVGIFVLNIWGIIVGPLIGAFVGEMIALRRPNEALGASFGAFVGCLAGSLIKLVLVMVMAGFFIASLF